MKQRFYALLALLLVAVLTAALLCGCHSKSENPSDETSVAEPMPTADSDSENTTAQKSSMTNDEITTDPKETTGIAVTVDKNAGTTNQSKTQPVPEKDPETTTLPPQTEAPAKVSEAKTLPSQTEAPAKAFEAKTLPSQTETPPKEHTHASFTACSVNTAQFGTFRYWLYTPSDPTENMPLIVYLHGGSGKGDDLNLITDVDGFPQYLQSGQLGDVRAYVVIPQLPSTQKGWVNAAESISELIDHTVSTYKINRNNISLTGHSMGGTGTWNLACTYPSWCARIAPLTGSIRNTPDIIDNLKNIPVRTFVGSADTIVPPDSSKEVIAALKAAGGSAEITVFDGADHFSVPSLTFLDTNIELIGWLIGG